MYRHAVKYISLLLIFCVSIGCSRSALHNAQTVVAQADSLWHAGQIYGIDQGDSATLAQAYETLGQFAKLSIVNSQLSIAYAHACYHYGRLLRKKDDPVSAMQVFINATHSHTRDYHILGRIYSNMGSICHSADEYTMAFDMYELTANLFLQNRDSLSYYYALNDMAFEKTMLADKKEALSLIEKIENQCTYNDVLSKIYETKAELYLRTQQYDSALYYVNRYDTNENNEPLGLLIKAQVYSYLSEKDSAVYYAKQVLLKSHNLSQINNAQYILTNDDISQGVDYIREIAAGRADTQKLLETLYGNSKQATQLLQQDLNLKPDLRWLYAVLTTLLVITLSLWLYVNRKRHMHTLLSQQLEDLKSKSQEIKQEHDTHKKNLITQLEQNCLVITQNKEFPNNINWKDFETMRKIVDTNFNMFVSKLCHIGILNETEIRLCILVLLNLDRNIVSNILPYAKTGVGKLKYRVAQKMGIEGKNLRKHLINIAINEH